ncbi:hypothetical protein IW261DRAFT_1441607 [Armillaria novae-zelandiae]|uniref:Uncharacterized protein n=1 Tax=Armillaria novae-zelandiae TaxID=153914 RepID=A0AA39UQS5_9AGAR|nr:hypothetical protein IW261DRAFT_1441607 [Armillaria novae-zelandiae]
MDGDYLLSAGTHHAATMNLQKHACSTSTSSTLTQLTSKFDISSRLQILITSLPQLISLHTAFPSDWRPCKDCACVNQVTTPSRPTNFRHRRRFPFTDRPNLVKLMRSNDAPDLSEENILQQVISGYGKRTDALDGPVSELKALKRALERLIVRVEEPAAG